MLKIRLSRVGKKNKAQFRVTVADGRRAPSGKFIEILGHYNPHTKERVLKNERIEYWISKGAKPSATVHNFLVDTGIIKGEKITSWKPKKKSKEELEKLAKETAEKAKKEAEKQEVKEEDKPENKPENKPAPETKEIEKKEEIKNNPKV